MSFAKGHERAHAWIEGAAILIAVAVVSLVTAISDYKKEGQFLKQLEIEIAGRVVSKLPRLISFLIIFQILHNLDFI